MSCVAFLTFRASGEQRTGSSPSADDRIIDLRGGTMNELLARLLEEELALVSELECGAATVGFSIPFPPIPVPLY
jgi:hypothetical protein